MLLEGGKAADGTGAPGLAGNGGGPPAFTPVDCVDCIGVPTEAARSTGSGGEGDENNQMSRKPAGAEVVSVLH